MPTRTSCEPVVFPKMIAQVRDELRLGSLGSGAVASRDFTNLCLFGSLEKFERNSTKWWGLMIVITSLLSPYWPWFHDSCYDSVYNINYKHHNLPIRLRSNNSGYRYISVFSRTCGGFFFTRQLWMCADWSVLKNGTGEDYECLVLEPRSKWSWHSRLKKLPKIQRMAFSHEVHGDSLK